MNGSKWLILTVILVVIGVVIAKQARNPSQSPRAQVVAQSPTRSEPVQSAAAAEEPVTHASPGMHQQTPADADDEAQADRPAPSSANTPSAPASRPQPDQPASQPTAQAPSAPAASAPTSANPLPGSALAGSLRSGKPTMADFGAGWCRACQEQEPILHQAVARYQGKANVVYVDTNQYPDLTRQYGIRVIPTQIFFDAQGNEVSRHMGGYPLADIDRDFAALGATP